MRNSRQLRAAIEKQEAIVRTATAEMTRNYARERISYLKGELMLQKKYEENEARKEWNRWADAIDPSLRQELEQ